jgi:hypothetical protein
VGTLAGPVLGTIFYILVREQLAITLVGAYQIIFGALFIVVVLAMPGGLIAGWQRWRRRLGPTPWPPPLGRGKPFGGYPKGDEGALSRRAADSPRRAP